MPVKPHVLWLVLVTLVVSCNEEPIPYGSSDTSINIDTLTVSSIYSVSYQIPPQMGNNTKLYIGRKEGYESPLSLIEIYSRSAGIPSNMFSSYADSSVTIDSAIFSISLAVDSIPVTSTFSLFYFPFGGDSLFHETQSNYLNLSESELLADAQLIGQEPLVEVFVDSNTVIPPQLSYHLPREVVDYLADTSGVNDNRTFLLKADDVLDVMIPFASRETGNGPRITLYYRRFAVNSEGDTLTDTSRVTFVARKDMSLIIPGELTDQDTTLVSVGRAKGLNAIIQINLDPLTLPELTVIKSAELVFNSSDAVPGGDFGIIAYPLIDTVDISSFQFHESDPYAVNPVYPMSATLLGGQLKVQIRSFLQAVHFDRISNLGIKFIPNSTNDPFQVVHFYTNEQDTLTPYLKIQYVAP